MEKGKSIKKVKTGNRFLWLHLTTYSIIAVSLAPYMETQMSYSVAELIPFLAGVVTGIIFTVMITHIVILLDSYE